MDYLKFYQLQSEPFQSDPDPSFYFEAHQQNRVIARVVRAFRQRKALCAVLGEAGCGKTTLAQRLLTQLEQSQALVRLVAIPPQTDGDWLVRTVANAYADSSSTTPGVMVLEQLRDALVAATALGRQPLLLLDDADLLDASGCRAMRGLLSLELDGKRLLSAVALATGELPAPLASRVDVGVRMGPLDQDETTAYLEARVRTAGGEPGAMLSDDALSALYRYSGGVPRVLNALADGALYEGFESETRPIDASLVASAASDLGIEPAPLKQRTSQRPVRGASPLDPPTTDTLETITDMKIIPADGTEATVPTPPGREPEPEEDSGSDFELDLGDDDDDLAAVSEPKPNPKRVELEPLELADDDSLPSLDDLFNKIKLND